MVFIQAVVLQSLPMMFLFCPCAQSGTIEYTFSGDKKCLCPHSWLLSPRCLLTVSFSADTFDNLIFYHYGFRLYCKMGQSSLSWQSCNDRNRGRRRCNRCRATKTGFAAGSRSKKVRKELKVNYNARRKFKLFFGLNNQAIPVKSLNESTRSWHNLSNFEINRFRTAQQHHNILYWHSS